MNIQFKGNLNTSFSKTHLENYSNNLQESRFCSYFNTHKKRIPRIISLNIFSPTNLSHSLSSTALAPSSLPLPLKDFFFFCEGIETRTKRQQKTQSQKRKKGFPSVHYHLSSSITDHFTFRISALMPWGLEHQRCLHDRLA